MASPFSAWWRCQYALATPPTYPSPTCTTSHFLLRSLEVQLSQSQRQCPNCAAVHVTAFVDISVVSACSGMTASMLMCANVCRDAQLVLWYRFAAAQKAMAVSVALHTKLGRRPASSQIAATVGLPSVAALARCLADGKVSHAAFA